MGKYFTYAFGGTRKLLKARESESEMNVRVITVYAAKLSQHANATAAFNLFGIKSTAIRRLNIFLISPRRNYVGY